MNYDVVYLGTSIRMPSWSLLILGAPSPDKVGGIYLSEDAKKSMNFDANWGLVLKVGDRAFEATDGTPNESPYKAGDWVMFEDFHPEARYINKTLVYFIPDSRIICALDDPQTFGPFLDFEETLAPIREDARILREELLNRSCNT